MISQARRTASNQIAKRNNHDILVVRFTIRKRNETSVIEEAMRLYLAGERETPVIAWALGILQTNNP